MEPLVSAVQLVRIEQVGSTPAGPLLTFHLKNISSKSISAVVVITPDGGTHLGDYFGSDPLVPGATYSFTTVDRYAPATERILRIPALVFSDGTAEGDPGEIEYIKALRLGIVLETERINRVLESFGPEKALKNANVSSVLDAVGMPPRSAEDAAESVRHVSGPWASAFEAALSSSKTRFALRTGVSNTRQNVRRQLAELGGAPVPPMPEATQVGAAQAGTARNLADLQTRIRSLIARQKAELEAMR